MKDFVNSPVGIIVIIVAIIAVLYIIIYNALNAKRNRVKKAFAQVDNFLRERAHDAQDGLDIVLTSTDKELEKIQIAMAGRAGVPVKEFAKQLKDDASNYDKMDENQKIGFANRLGSFRATMENYPQFDNIVTFARQQNEAFRNNEQVTAAITQYNSNVTSYNTSVTAFPTSIVAGINGFKEMELYQLFDEGTRKDLLKVNTNTSTGALAKEQGKNTDK